MARQHLIVFVLATGAAAPAAAQVRPHGLEVSPLVGFWEGDAQLSNSPTFGGAVAFNVNRVFAVEAMYTLVLSEFDLDAGKIDDGTREGKVDKSVHQFGLDGVVHLSDAALVPYLSAGAGFVKVDDVDYAYNIGVGAKYFINDMFGVRVDFRGWFSPDAPAQDEFAHFAAMLGADIQIGGNHDIDDDGIVNRLDECVSTAEDKDNFKDEDGCPDRDNDSDTILDETDKCPNQAEDKDGDQDEDGCPDLDDDADLLLNDVDKCPKEAEDKDGFQDEDGCPDPDNDADGVLDAADKCPEPEDKDGFEDDDGCPDRDNDKDGILDATDKCPLEAEIINGVDDGDGCPDQGLVKLGDARIEVLDKVYFKTGKAVLDPKSFVLLDQVAGIMVSQARIKKLSVEGHTDNKGSAKGNVKLSKARADAVVAYLVSKGIDATRLVSVGSGGEKPITENGTEDGRAQNRRVDFNIVE